jgi:hypothetical protein
MDDHRVPNMRNTHEILILSGLIRFFRLLLTGRAKFSYCSRQI